MGTPLRKWKFPIKAQNLGQALFFSRAISHEYSSNDASSMSISSQRILNNLALRGLKYIWFTVFYGVIQHIS
jgi:hypothetical protein